MTTRGHMRQAGLALALATGMVLSGCGEEAPVAEAPAADTIEGVTITNPRLVLAPVSGNPAAVYFDFAYDGDRAFSIDRVEVEGAQSATMHQFGEYNFKVQMMDALPIPVTKGTKVEFKPGDYHIMVEGASPDLAPGGTAKITLIVSGGKRHSFDAEVRAAGDER